MTISDKLALLEQTKEAQRVKLGLPESFPFSQYIKFIRDPFTPDELFKNGEQGVWLDPSDLSTMFQDVKGRTPVTRDGQPVGLFLDKSQGLHLKDVTSLVSVVTTGGVTSEPTEHGTRYTVGNSAGGVSIRDTDPLKTYKVEMTYSLEGSASWYIKVALEEGENKKVEFISGPEDYGYRLYIRGSNFNITIHSLEVFEITGNHATQETSAARPVYRTDGELHWLEFDGVDDTLTIQLSSGSYTNIKASRDGVTHKHPVSDSSTYTLGDLTQTKQSVSGLVLVNIQLTQAEIENVTNLMKVKAGQSL